MNDALGLLLVVSVSGVGLTALLATLWLLLPGPVARSQQVLETAPWRAFWLGLATLVLSLALAALLGTLSQAVIPPVAAALIVLVLLILGGLIILAALGLAGLVALLRARMGAAASLVGMAQASGVLCLAALTPIVGWWVFAPLAVITALGAGALTMVRARHWSPAPVADPALAAPANVGSQPG